MNDSIKGLVEKFLDEVKVLANKPSNEKSLDELCKKIDEFEATTKTALMRMRSIMSYLYSRIDYNKSVQELNEIIDGKTIPEIKCEFVHKKKWFRSVAYVYFCDENKDSNNYERWSVASIVLMRTIILD